MKDPPSPWHNTPDDLKVNLAAGSGYELIAYLTPSRTKIRVGMLIRGADTSVVVPFEKAEAFLDAIRTLILEKGKT